MADDSIESELQIFFSKSTKADWENIAMQETRGKNPFEKLSWHGKDGILFLPYYDANDTARLPFLNTFNLPAEKKNSARSWISLPPVKCSTTEDSNELALEHLAQGAEGVLFDLRSVSIPDLNKLTNNIQWPSCYIDFYSDGNPDLLISLSDLIKNKFNPATIHGTLFWESIPKRSNFDFYFSECKNFKTLGLIIPGASPAFEVCQALLEGVKAYEAFADSSPHQQDTIFRSIGFSLSAEASFAETVSKFKALRILWFQIAQAYGHEDYNYADLYIHAMSLSASDGDFGPHENMLKATYAAVASVLGGCDALSIEGDHPPSLFPRWSRNVSSILREESFFSNIADPLAGAYALDAITNSIAKSAWELFQEKVKTI